MRHYRFPTVLTLAGALICGGFASAADLALIVSNGDTLRGKAARGVNEGHDALVTLYRDMGYEAMEGQNVSRSEFRELLVKFNKQVENGDGKVVVHYSGLALTIGDDTVVIPADMQASNKTGVVFASVPLATLMETAAARPNEGSVILAINSSQHPDYKEFAEKKLSVQVPEGVLAVYGPAADVNALVSNDFLTLGLNAAQVASRTDTVTLAGNVSESSGLNPSGSGAELGRKFAQETLWTLAISGNDEILLRAYLDRFPKGAHAAEAQERLNINPASEGEEALNLTRSARRDIQQNLTILGYNTRGIDGIFGPGTRGSIGSWQKKAEVDETGYLTERQVGRIGRDARARRQELQEEEKARLKVDNAFWQDTGKSGKEADLRRYLRRYPNGAHSKDARRRMDVIAESGLRDVLRDERDAWNIARDKNTVPAYTRYKRNFPQGRFVDMADDRIADLNRNNKNTGNAAEYERAEKNLGLNKASVEVLEQRLKSLGYDTGKVDGEIDGKTRRSIGDFQSSQGLDRTRYLNTPTIQRLIIASS